MITSKDTHNARCFLTTFAACLAVALLALGGSSAQGGLIDIVDIQVNLDERADVAMGIDGDVGTKTFMTNSFPAGGSPHFTWLDFTGGAHFLARTRINTFGGNDNNFPVSWTLRYTTDTDADLSLRTYQDVTGMVVEALSEAGDTAPADTFPTGSSVIGNTYWPAIPRIPNVSQHDGFYSVRFDPIPNATGLEYEWSSVDDADNAAGFQHWTVREFEAYTTPALAAASVPEPSTFALAALGLLSLACVSRRRR